MTSQLVFGKIPPHTVCPFRTQCNYALRNECHHKGVEHTIPFSCGTARMFQIFFNRKPK